MKSISNAPLHDKSRPAQVLPENGAQVTLNPEIVQKTSEQRAARKQRSRQWLADFDQWANLSHSKAIDDGRTIERFLSHNTLPTVEEAQSFQVLPPFPFLASSEIAGASLEEMDAIVKTVSRRLRVVLFSASMDGMEVLLRFWALHLLRAQFQQFENELKEAAWFSCNDEHASRETPMFYALFERYLQHSGRTEELKADGLRISDVLFECQEFERDAAYFAKIFEETLVRLVEEKRDRLAVITQLLPQHARPQITAEEEAQDSSLSLVIRHWEREHAPRLAALEAEKAQLEVWLATDGLETAYWWARDVLPGLDDCAIVIPALGLMLDHWKGEGIAGAEITAEAIFDQLFQDDTE